MNSSFEKYIQQFLNLKPIWRSKSKEYNDLKEIDDNHLINIVKYLENKYLQTYEKLDINREGYLMAFLYIFYNELIDRKLEDEIYKIYEKIQAIRDWIEFKLNPAVIAEWEVFGNRSNPKSYFIELLRKNENAIDYKFIDWDLIDYETKFWID